MIVAYQTNFVLLELESDSAYGLGWGFRVAFDTPTYSINNIKSEDQFMKLNYLSDAAKILIFAATIIVVCVLCAIGFKTANEGKSIVSSGSSQLNAMSSEYQDVNKSIYDGSTILGSELVSMINKTIEKKEYLAIVVKTLANGVGSGVVGTHYNYTHELNEGVSSLNATRPTVTPTPEKRDNNYINPSAQFLGTVYKDKNNNVICIEFVQQD